MRRDQPRPPKRNAIGQSTSITPTKISGLGSSSALSAAAILAKLLTVDGAGSGLDADLLDGQHGAYYQSRANHTGTQLAATISDFATAADARIAAAVGVSVQAQDPQLAAIAASVPAADQIHYWTSATSVLLTGLTSVARTLISQTTQALMRSTGLGLGTSAVIDTGTSGTKVPLLDAANTWSLGQTITAGGLTVSAGGVGVTTGNVTISAGNLNLSAGNMIISPDGATLGGARAIRATTNGGFEIYNTGGTRQGFIGGISGTRLRLLAEGSATGWLITGDLSVTQPIFLGSFTIATLPASGDGGLAFASNGRKTGEGAGAGTGIPVYRDGGTWFRFADDTAAAA